LPADCAELGIVTEQLGPMFNWFYRIVTN